MGLDYDVGRFGLFEFTHQFSLHSMSAEDNDTGHAFDRTLFWSSHADVTRGGMSS